MGRRIFLDVGTHNGQTLEEVTKDGYHFDLIMGFEPMPAQWIVASQIYKGKALVFNFGLSDKTGIKTLYGDNINMGTSVYSEKNDVNSEYTTEAMMYRASDFIRMFNDDDQIIMKLNVEGAEIEIMQDIISMGMLYRIHNVMIDFDIRKVPGKEHLENALLHSLAHIGFNRYSLCDRVMVGHTHQDRIRNWLKSIGITNGTA